MPETRNKGQRKPSGGNECCAVALAAGHVCLCSADFENQPDTAGFWQFGETSDPVLNSATRPPASFSR